MSQRDKISVSNRIVDLKMSALYFFYDCEASSSGLHSDIIEVAVRCDPDVLYASISDLVLCYIRCCFILCCFVDWYDQSTSVC